MMMKVNGDDLNAVGPVHVSTRVDTDGDSDNSVLGDIGDDRRPGNARQFNVSRCAHSERG